MIASIFFITLGILFFGWVVVEIIDGGINGLLSIFERIGNWFRYEPETKAWTWIGVVAGIIIGIAMSSWVIFFLLIVIGFVIGRIHNFLKER